MARSLAALLLALVALCAAAVAPAQAATRLVTRGAGFGHGVGMSQYGAEGQAQAGRSYREILGHYYTDTAIGRGAPRTVRVLLQGDRGSARFSGATAAAGRRLNPARTYSVRRGPGATVELLSPTGRRLKRVAGRLRVRGKRPVRLHGPALNGRSDGTYRGALEFRPGTVLGVIAVNAVNLEQYLRGVVPDEMPPSWHSEALKAQAIAARTYAVTTSKAGNGWDQYPDTRSQVYGGVAAEEPQTDAAIEATRGELVTYDGVPVVTYFFSTSGGRTENVETSALGGSPQPWLKSVADPWDKISPRHRWGPIRMTLKRAGAKLRGLVKGSFRGIEVIRRGRSPRIVHADVIGTRGRTRVTGATLRARLGLFDSWAYFTTIGADEKPPPENEEEPPAETDPTGGTSPGARSARRGSRQITGLALPVRPRRDVLVQVRQNGRWARAGLATVNRRGRYAFTAPAPGTYRVKYRGERSAPVRVR